MFNKKKLNTMIIGGDRSGSTWIHDLCSQHPDIYVCPNSRKDFLSKQEVLKRRFFSKLKFNCTMDNYNNQKIVMGMRNMQIYHTPKVAKMYFDYNPEIKFLLSIRHPVERTVSQFQVRSKLQVDAGSSQVIFNINEDINKEQTYLRRSYIYSMLKPYLNFFPKKNFLIFPIEKVNLHPQIWMNQIFSFLDLKEFNELNFEKSRTNKRKIKSSLKFIEINDDTKKKIISWCMEDISRLSNLIQLDLVRFWNLD